MADSARRLFGEYELLEEIAHGGMGVVYRARQLKLNRVVALKLILSGRFARRDSVQRFRGEAAAAGVLQHPNIVAIHEIGMHEGQHFFSMDYVAGQNLAQVVGNRPLPALKAARYVQLIAQAIHYAHEQGILHRDLKPSNVLIQTATDQPRVTDFGLAKWLEGESSLTISGQVLGSPNFMPPEQTTGSGGRVSRRSDVYGLGGILYFLLTARAPYQGETIESILHQALHVEPIAPRLLNSGVPVDLQTICLKCLEKDPAKRYATAQELADDLGRFLNNEPVHARPVGQTQKLWRWCRRKPALATLGALVLVLLLVVVVGAPIAFVRIDRARGDVEWSLYADDMRLASELLRNGATDQVQELLDKYQPRKGAKDLRAFEWRYLQHATKQTGLVTHQLKGLGKVRSPSHLIVAGDILYNVQDEMEILGWDMTSWLPLPLKFPPNRASVEWWGAGGNLNSVAQAVLAVDVKNRTIAVYGLPSFAQVSLISVPGQTLQAAVNKDLRNLAVACQDTNAQHILMWDMAAGSEPRIFSDYYGKVQYLGFSPEGSTLVAAYSDGGIGLWSVSDGKKLPTPARSTAWEEWQQEPFFGPGSTRLFLNRGPKALEVWDWSTGQLSTYQAESRSKLQAFAFSPDGAVLAAGVTGVGIMLLDARESRQIGAIPSHGKSITHLAFSPSGRLIVSASQENTTKIWDVKTQRDLAALGGGSENQVCEAAFTPDERSVLTLELNGSIKVRDLGAVLSPGVLWHSTNGITRFAMSADDHTIGTLDAFGRIHVSDLRKRNEIGSFDSGGPTTSSRAVDLIFSPKGNTLAWAGWTSFGILDYESGQTNTLPIGGRTGHCRPAFSHNGREVAFTSPTNIMIWDISTQKASPFAATENTVIGLDFSPNGSLLASAHVGGAVVLWDPASGLSITNVLAHPPIAYDVEFSPDGRLLATAGSGAIIKVWEVIPGGLKLRYTLRGNVGWVAFAFSPDGLRLASNGGDNTVKLWDTKTGLEVGTLYGPYAAIAGFAFSHDGNKLYSASQDGEVRVWEAPPLESARRPGG
jgi:WD40 repeat protein/tRNA A-37 threonylcarbamoyl transferase component Bud32